MNRAITPLAPGSSPAPTPSLIKQCPYPSVARNTRFSAGHTANHGGHAVVLATDRDVAWALRAWLICMIAFDRAEGCWVLIDQDESRTGLVVTEVNEEITDPRALSEAQLWATHLLDAGIRLTAYADHEADAPTVPTGLWVTEWLEVWIGVRGYAPLFADTPLCRLPFPARDQVTGSACVCVPADEQRRSS